jgi:hypothetical protein
MHDVFTIGKASIGLANVAKKPTPLESGAMTVPGWPAQPEGRARSFFGRRFTAPAISVTVVIGTGYSAECCSATRRPSKAWRFTPATKDGVPVKFATNVKVTW